MKSRENAAGIGISGILILLGTAASGSSIISGCLSGSANKKF